MKVTQPSPITEFLSSTERTFEIPVYQRNYDWDTENCEKMFDDVLEGIHSHRKHYFGNIVYYIADLDLLSAYARLILIDGQQRITSTMLLLAAIRDEEKDAEKKSMLTSTYLTNEKAEEEFRVKLKQVESDRDVYEAIVTSRFETINKASTIYRNYNKFRTLLRNAKAEYGYTSADFLTGIKCLDIVAIDLESEKEGTESPQVIFESINATGKPLSTADLLRNFLLLEVGVDRQKEFYEKYWLTIEKNVGNDNISDFIRRYITLKTTEDIKKDTEYKEFKKSYKAHFDNAEIAIAELAHFSKYYRWVKRPEVIGKEHPKLSYTLQDLDDLRMLPATPAIMWLLEKADSGNISFKEVNDTLNVIASWSFRARITNIISTGEIGGILTTRILDLLKSKQDSTEFADYIHFELSNYRIRDIYPSDKAFKEAFARYDFYKKYRRYVQQKLSSVVSNDQTEIVLESIEHIMPQTLRADKWPGITPSEHVEWVNTIGNLTPLNMPDNITNSNHSFAEKIDNIRNSDWQITREIPTDKGWGIEQIKERGRSLAEKATVAWMAPLERTRDVELVKSGSQRKPDRRFVDWINEFSLPYITLDLENSSRAFLRFTTDFMDSLIPYRDDKDGGWRNGKAYYYEIRSDSTGWTRVALSINSESRDEQQKSGQNIVMDTLGKHPSKDTWKWFSPIGWTLESEEGDATLKDDLRRVLEDEIPSVEAEFEQYQDEAQ